MKKTILFVFILILSISAKSQTLIPYLAKNGLYGYADENGKMVIEPKFTEAGLFNRKGYAVVKSVGTTIKDVLFRNGNIIRAESHLNNDDDPYLTNAIHFGQKKLDTLQHIFFVNPYENTKLIYNCLSNKSLKKKVVYHFDKSYHEFDSEKYNFSYQKSSGYFYHGFCETIENDKGEINFIDTSLNYVFAQPVESAEILEDGFFNVKKGNQYFLANKKGQTISRFPFRSLSKVMNKNLFIINMPYEDADGQTLNCVGLINGSGDVLLDTIYHSVRAFDDSDFLLLEKDSMFFSMNLADNSKVELGKFSKVELFGEYYLIKKQVGYQEKAFLYDRNQIRMIDDDYQSMYILNILKDGVHERRLNVNYKDKTVLLDSKLKILATFSSEIGILERKNGFTLTRYVNNQTLIGIANSEGKIILNPEFDNIEFSPKINCWKVTRNGKKGLFRKNGKVVFACENYDILHKENMFWVCKNKLDNYYPFDNSGIKIDMPSKFDVSSNRITFREINDNFDSVLLRNGAVVSKEIGNEYEQKYKTFGHSSYYFANSRRTISICNFNFEPLIPNGFVAISEYNQNHESGFVVVSPGKNLDTLIEKSEKSAGFDNDDVKTARIGSYNNYIDGLSSVERMKKLGYDENETGIVDLKGNFIFQSKPQTNYLVLNKNLVVETPIKEGEKDFTRRKIIFLNKKNLNLFYESSILDKNKALKYIINMQERKNIEGKTEKYLGVLDTFGNVLMPCKYKVIEYVAEYDRFICKNNNQFFDVFDSKCKQLNSKPIANSVDSYHEKYYYKRYRDEIIKKNFIIVRNKIDSVGVYDTNGNELLPQENKGILIFNIPNDKSIIQVTTHKDSLVFFDSKGTQIKVEAQYSKKSEYYFHTFDNNYSVLILKNDRDDNPFYVFDQNLNLLYKKNGKLYDLLEKDTFLKMMYNNKFYYLNVVTGFEYRDK